MKVEPEVVRSGPSGDVCQTFRDAHCSVGVGGWGESKELSLERRQFPESRVWTRSHSL